MVEKQASSVFNKDGVFVQYYLHKGDGVGLIDKKAYRECCIWKNRGVSVQRKCQKFSIYFDVLGDSTYSNVQQVGVVFWCGIIRI